MFSMAQYIIASLSCLLSLLRRTFCFLSPSYSLIDPPSVEGSPPNTAVVEGHNVTLQFNITGNPTPNVTWTKDGNATVLYKGERFTIYNITQQQAGDYICSAWNQIDKTNATVTVTVHCKYCEYSNLASSSISSVQSNNYI